MANMLDYDILVSKFEVHLRNYVQFLPNIFKKVMNPLSHLLWIVGLLFGFNGISIFVGYLMPNPFLYK